MIEPNLHIAIKAINPLAEYTMIGDNLSTINWIVGTPIAIADIEAKQAELQVAYDALEYSRQRKENYPVIGDQLDMLWHAIDTNTLDKTSDFYSNLKTVKDTYPKE